MQLTREQSRAVDKYAIEQLGMSSLVLMENAGRGCVDLLERKGIHGPVAVFCGKGNNGGDGFVIARHLIIRGYEARVLLAAHANDLTGDGLANYKILRHTNAQVVELANEGGPSALPDALDYAAASCEWFVDALLGTGIEGAPRPPYDAIIEWMNSESAATLAVDVPSGLDCNTGQPSPTTIEANLTATFVASKVGYATDAAKQHLGELHVLDIGIPPSLVELWLAEA